MTTSSENHAFTHEPREDARKLKTYNRRKIKLATKIALKSLLIASSKKNCKTRGIIIEKAVPKSKNVTLAQAVALATAHNHDYQIQKEALYLTALDLTLAKHEFDSLGPEANGVLTISGGLATFPWDGNTCRELLRHADGALHQAK